MDAGGTLENVQDCVLKKNVTRMSEECLANGWYKVL